MGCYDEIETNKKCLKCGKIIKTMQTKSTACLLKTYKINDEISFEGGTIINSGVIEIHGYCEHCLYWHDGQAIIKNNRLVKITNLVLGESIGQYEKRGNQTIIGKKR